MGDLNCSGIYKIVNTLNGKYYIGSSQNIKTRIRKHFELLKRNVHHSIYLQNSYNLHGKNVYECCLIECCDVNDLINVEQNYLDGIDDWSLVYNINKTATGGGYDLSIHPNETEIRERMSKANTGKHTKPYFINDIKYDTLQEGANELGVDFSTIGNRLRNWNNKDYYYINNPKIDEFCEEIHGDTYKFIKPREKKKYYCSCGCGKEITKYAKYHKDCRKLNQLSTHKNNPVIINDIEYITPKEASKKLNVEYATLIYRINSTTITFKDYFYKNKPKNISKLITIEEINKKISEKNKGNNCSNHKPFIINSIKYGSLKIASKELLIPRTTIRNRLNNIKYVNYYYI